MAVDDPKHTYPMIQLLGGSFIPFQKWIDEGPAPRHLYPIDTLYCEFEGQWKAIGKVPIQYRNNDLSHFLTAMHVIRDPWGRSSESIEGFPTALRVLENDNEVNINLSNNLRTVSLEPRKFWWIGNDLYSNVHLAEVSGYSSYVCQVFGQHYVMLNKASAGYSIVHKRPNDLVFCIHAQPKLAIAFDPYIESFIPDETFGVNTKIIQDDIEGYLTKLVITVLPKTDFSLLIGFMRIPGRKPSAENLCYMLRLFGVWSHEKADELLQEGYKILGSVTHS